MKEIRRLVFQLILLLIALFVLYLLAVFVPVFRAPGLLRFFEATAPPTIRPTPESAAIARAPQSFQYLVSFTDRGFEPASLVVKKGETFRFTNNTARPMRVVGSDAPFPSPEAVGPREYIEVTFAESGEYSYPDIGTERAGAIRVE